MSEHFKGDQAKYEDGSLVGEAQSPINITQAVLDKSLDDLQIAYQSSQFRAVNDGHTIRVDYDPGSFITFQHQQYELVQFHFHSPAEHQINGQVFPMCAHLVHKNSKGQLLVVGIKMTEGAAQPFLAQFWERLPAGQWDVSGDLRINVQELFPASLHYFTYQGSLTTPPYTEGVTWVVMKETVEVARSQIQKFLALVGPDARPVQALNHRPVKEH